MTKNNLQSHINTDVRKDIDKLYSHADIANGEMSAIRVCISKIGTDVDWLKRSYWVIATASVGGLVAGVVNLIK